MDQRVERVQDAQSCRRIGKGVEAVDHGREPVEPADDLAIRARHGDVLHGPASVPLTPRRRFPGRDGVEEARDLRRRRGDQSLQRFDTGPPDELWPGHGPPEVVLGDDPLGEIVDLLLPVPAGDRQRADPPQVLHRHLRERRSREVRIGPFDLPGDDVARRQGPPFPNGLQHPRPHRGRHLREIPAVSRMALAAAEAPEVMLPVRIELHREDGGAVGPVLERRPFRLQGLLQVGPAVPVVAGEQNVMVRPLHGRDAVDLHVGESQQRLVNPRRAGRGGHRRQGILRRRRGKAGRAEERVAEVVVREDHRRLRAH